MSNTMREVVVLPGRRRNARFLWSGTVQTPREVRFRLVREGASLDVLGVFVVRGEEELPLRLEVVHEAPETRSNVVLRGIVADRGFACVHEVAVLKKGAKGAETHVEAKAILRSEQAKAELEPYMEIDEDDVRATHSAWVGPLEEEEIFYLMSRGLPRKVAEKMLIEAFFAPVLGVIATIKYQKSKIHSKNQKFLDSTL